MRVTKSYRFGRCKADDGKTYHLDYHGIILVSIADIGIEADARAAAGPVF